MKEYFIVVNGDKEGPLSLEALKAYNITKVTLVWEENFDDWKKASDVPEFNDLLKKSPPPIPVKKKETPPPFPIRERKTPPPPPQATKNLESNSEKSILRIKKSETPDSSVDIKSLNYAGFGARLGAYLIDIIPIVLITMFIFYLFVGDELFSDEYTTSDTEGLSLNGVVRNVSFFLWICYCTAMESSSLQATYGKKLMGIKVTDDEGNKISTEKSMIRNSFKIVSYIAILMGFLWVLFNKEKKGWHDLVAGTSVVKPTE